MSNPFDNFRSKVERSLQEVGKKENMDEIGAEAKEIVKRRTRLGYGVNGTGQDRVALKPLSPTYKEARTAAGKIKKAKAKVIAAKSNSKIKLSKKTSKDADKNSEPLSDSTSAGKSNLTYTGQMLDSLQHISQDNAVTIRTTGSRKDGQTNESVAEKVTKDGRPFLDLAKGDLNQLKVKLSAIVDRIFKGLK